MRQSDVLLLIHGEGIMCDEYIPSKLYEYLLTHRPILGLVEPGSELEGFLRESGNYVVASCDVAAIKNIISPLIDKWEINALQDHTKKSPFTIEFAVRKLLDIVDAV